MPTRQIESDLQMPSEVDDNEYVNRQTRFYDTSSKPGLIEIAAAQGSIILIFEAGDQYEILLYLNNKPKLEAGHHPGDRLQDGQETDQVS